MPRAPRLSRSFFDRPTLTVARKLLGQRLVFQEHKDTRLSGLIIETEAYIGEQDLGCHAKSGRTKRNLVMWGAPGHIYVYFTYGMHWMLNFVTEREGFPAAVLIRALEPLEGIEKMRERRSNLPLTDGPAKLCQALGINRELNGSDLCVKDSNLWVERQDQIPEEHVTMGPRVGLNSVEEPWKSIPWRYKIDRVPEAV